MTILLLAFWMWATGATTQPLKIVHDSQCTSGQILCFDELIVDSDSGRN